MSLSRSLSASALVSAPAPVHTHASAQLGGVGSGSDGGSGCGSSSDSGSDSEDECERAERGWALDVYMLGEPMDTNPRQHTYTYQQVLDKLRTCDKQSRELVQRVYWHCRDPLRARVWMEPSLPLVRISFYDQHTHHMLHVPISSTISSFIPHVQSLIGESSDLVLVHVARAIGVYPFRRYYHLMREEYQHLSLSSIHAVPVELRLVPAGKGDEEEFIQQAQASLVLVKQLPVVVQGPYADEESFTIQMDTGQSVSDIRTIISHMISHSPSYRGMDVTFTMSSMKQMKQEHMDPEEYHDPSWVVPLLSKLLNEHEPGEHMSIAHAQLWDSTSSLVVEIQHATPKQVDSFPLTITIINAIEMKQQEDVIITAHHEMTISMIKQHILEQRYPSKSHHNRPIVQVWVTDDDEWEDHNTLHDYGIHTATTIHAIIYPNSYPMSIHDIMYHTSSALATIHRFMLFPEFSSHHITHVGLETYLFALCHVISGVYNVLYEKLITHHVPEEPSEEEEEQHPMRPYGHDINVEENDLE